MVEKPISPLVKRDENLPPNSPPLPVQVEYIFKKNKAPFAIPPTLSLQAFQSASHADAGDTATAEEALGESLEKGYELKSIVHHIGSRASSGHYTADAVRLDKSSQDSDTSEKKSTEPIWVTFDDGNTSRTTLKKIVENPFKQGTAYMLLYILDDD